MNSFKIKRGIALIKCYGSSYLGNKFNLVQKIDRLTIAVTNRCNSRCITCDIWKNKSDVAQEISLIDIKRLIASPLFAKVNELSITGGEPFLRNDIDEILKLLFFNTNALLSIATNGLLVNKIVTSVKDLKKNGGGSLRIVLSLNGKPAAHDQTRGVKGNYDKVIETIEELKSLGVYSSLIFTITKENFDQIEWAYELSKQLQVDINFFPEIDSYRFEKSPRARELSETEKQKALRQLIKVYNQRKHYFFDDSTLYYIVKAFKSIPPGKCYGGLQTAFINWDGEVYPCEGIQHKKYSFGNIKEQVLDQIWRSPGANRVRNYVKEDRCQPCFLACEIIPSLRKDFFSVIAYALKRRIFKNPDA